MFGWCLEVNQPSISCLDLFCLDLWTKKQVVSDMLVISLGFTSVGL